MRQPTCDCFGGHENARGQEVCFHVELQDTHCDGWKRLAELIENAAEDQRKVFAPLSEIPWEEWDQIVTLPPTIGMLKSVETAGHGIIPTKRDS